MLQKTNALTGGLLTWTTLMMSLFSF